jgi:hypothetical protein
MKSSLPWILVLSLTFLIQRSCEESSDCELTDYALPEMEILDPEDGEIVWPYQGSNPQVSLRLKAEAGLNTLALVDSYGYSQPIKAFISGEKELVYTFELDYIYNGIDMFVLHDLCNQRVEVEASVVFEGPPSR